MEKNQLELVADAGAAARVLGPTVDYFGAEIRVWTEKRLNNLQRVVEAADRKLAGDVNESIPVPARVAGAVFEQGSWCEDEVAIEYLGGVLASSKAGHIRDDRGTRWVTIIARLSTYAIRLHYLLYRSAQAALAGMELDPRVGDDLAHSYVFVPYDQVVDAMEFADSEDHRPIVSDSLWTLFSEDLLGYSAMGSPEMLKQWRVSSPVTGIVYRLSNPGIGLWLWGNGLGTADMTAFFQGPALAPVLPLEVRGVRPIHDPTFFRQSELRTQSQLSLPLGL